MFKEIEETITELLTSGESLYSISKGSGVSYSTVHDLSEKLTYDMVRFKTIKQLYTYARKKGSEH
ncbi:hypothetical protein AWM75_08275 [Aerococcus urinaehominis]|uniref:Uncharacterized protein n=1 Tax=Aerococcus urinaehominis TaxID=128944 RepID=A0A109RHC0_9LACT|nr:hypothetical protein [Aerococcus urinaehominis]AMB99966.1 hypothetical protein AWM75_08275 [Aerococcus urinaehominis]SDM44853.1 hypothetical protein SAMN04487985_11715 [Aerococcus urinaehominis]